MNESTHKIVVKNVEYIYPCIVSATHVNNRYISTRRTYGINRTKEEAEALVLAWECKKP